MSAEMVTDILLPFALFTMMFGIGASTSISEFAKMRCRPRPLLAGIASLSLLSPLAGMLVAVLLRLPAELALGLVLLASCPGGLFSNYMTALGRGALALSISLTSIVSIFYVFTAPFWAQTGIQFFHSSVNEAVIIQYSKILQPLLIFLLLPVSLGLICNMKWPAIAAKLNRSIRDSGGLAAIGCFLIIVYAQRESFLENFSLAFMPVLVFNLFMVGIGLMIGKLLALNSSEMAALIIEHTIRQEATGIYIAVAVLGSLTATMPLLINTVIGMSVSSIVVLIVRRRNRAYINVSAD